MQHRPLSDALAHTGFVAGFVQLMVRQPTARGSDVTHHVFIFPPAIFVNYMYVYQKNCTINYAVRYATSCDFYTWRPLSSPHCDGCSLFRESLDTHGLTLQRLMFLINNVYLLKNSTFGQLNAFLFCMDLGKNSVLMGFITEMDCVYCAARTESLTIMQVGFRL